MKFNRLGRDGPILNKGLADIWSFFPLKSPILMPSIAVAYNLPTGDRVVRFVTCVPALVAVLVLR